MFHCNYLLIPENVSTGPGLRFQQDGTARPLAPNYTPEEYMCCVTEELIGSADEYSYRPDHSYGG